MTTITFIKDTRISGKLADVELIFHDGDLAHLKLTGFAIWERRDGSGINVTFPARAYTVNGERRSFALLRPADDTADRDVLGQRIADAYARWNRQPIDTSTTVQL